MQGRSCLRLERASFALMRAAIVVESYEIHQQPFLLLFILLILRADALEAASLQIS